MALISNSDPADVLTEVAFVVAAELRVNAVALIDGVAVTVPIAFVPAGMGASSATSPTAELERSRTVADPVTAALADRRKYWKPATSACHMPLVEAAIVALYVPAPTDNRGVPPIVTHVLLSFDTCGVSTAVRLLGVI